MMSGFLLWAPAPAAALSFAYFCVQGAVWIRARSWGRREALLVGVSFSIAGALLALFPPFFRVLSDETDFLNTAWSILRTGKAGGAQEWVMLEGALRPLRDYPSFRPALFPTLIAALAAVAGVKPWIPFALNFLFFGGLLSVAALATGLLSIPLVLALSPALVAAASSGGYDVAALFFGAVALVAWLRYARLSDGGSLPLALGAALCLAHTRIEGLLLCALLLPVWFRARMPWRRSWPILLALPLVILRLHFPGHVDVPSGEALFAWGRIPLHAAALLRVFFLSGAGPFPVLAHAAGVIALFSILRKQSSSVLAPGIYLGALLFFLLGFHGGDPDSETQARLFLPFSVLLGVIAGRGAGPALRGLLIGAGALALLLNAGNLRTPAHPMAEEMAALRERVEASPASALFLYPFPGHITALGRAALQPWRARQDLAWVLGAGCPVVWVEVSPPLEGAVPAPDWVGPGSLSNEATLGRLRSLRFYEKNSCAAPANKVD